MAGWGWVGERGEGNPRPDPFSIHTGHPDVCRGDAEKTDGHEVAFYQPTSGGAQLVLTGRGGPM